jgi:M6 family metalloprotease-like protein
VLAVLGLLVFAPGPVYAVPAYPRPVEVKQPDGTKFNLQLRGDEFFSWNETDEGYAIVKDSADGFWKYAKPATGQAGFEAVAGAVVGVANPSALGLKKDDLPARDALKAQVDKRKEVRGPTKVPAKTISTDVPTEPPAKIPVSGVTAVKNVVILACFSDHWDGVGSTVLAAKGRTITSEYTNLFNQIGHSTDGAVGSVKDYYKEVSYNKLTVDSVVTAWVLLPQNEAYYGANTGGGGSDIRPQQMVTDAIAAADAAGFDFSQGDSDADGWVDCLTVIHSGHGEEYGGNPTNCIWSHQWNMTSVVTADGKSMFRYHTEPALRGSTASTSIIRIGVICHEMGHFFGLPDLYDYSNTTLGLGNWCLMAGGSWNGSDGKRPSHFSAWPKTMLGFVAPKLISSSASAVSLPRVEDNAEVHMFRDGMSNGEYFLVENRANIGFDNDTAAIFPGILIHHVDSKSSNNDLGTWTHPAVKIEEADGNNSLGAKTASSQAGDVWTNTSGLGGGFRDQTTDQDCNAMMYQTAAYNRPDSSTYYSYIRLNTFSAAGSPMSYNASTLKPTVVGQIVGSPNFTVSWGACTNATVYEIQEGTSATVSSFSDGAETEADSLENWSFSGTVARDNSGARTGSYSYAMHQYFASKWGSSVQALTMRNPFRVTASTVISFYLMSHLSTGNGFMKCQISNDSGNTWKTLGTYSGYIDPWSVRSYNYANISALGIVANDMCLVRFVADYERAFGWSAFPGYGYAVDDIAVTGSEFYTYTGWATLSSSVPGTSYPVTGKPNGVYGYRVRAFANSVWQAFALASPTVVFPVTLSGFEIE